MNKDAMRAAGLLVLFAAGCAVAGARLPTAEHLARRSGADLSMMKNGRAHYVRECTACHRRYWPAEYPPAAWRGIGPDMAERSGLSPSDARDLTFFLVEASRAAGDVPARKRE